MFSDSGIIVSYIFTYITFFLCIIYSSTTLYKKRLSFKELIYFLTTYTLAVIACVVAFKTVYSIIFLIPLVFIFHSKNIKNLYTKSLFLIFYILIMSKIIDLLILYVFYIFKLDYSLKNILIKNIVFLLIIFFITPKVFFYLSGFFEKISYLENYILLIIFLINFILFIYYFISFINNMKIVGPATRIVTMFSILAFFIIFCILATMLLKNIKLEIKNKAELERIAQQKKYIEDLEKNNSEIRKFKHDFNNIILGLSGYINEDEINQEKLRDYFNNHIVPSNIRIKENTKVLFNLNNIKVASLKTILLNKLAIAQGKNIDVRIFIENEIDSVYTNEMEFTRVVGILLDNAVEACEHLDNKSIVLTILRIDKTIDLTISNTFENNGISIEEFKTEGFSTKGNGRGLGLKSAQEIVDKYNMILNTEIKDNIFKQNLIIEGEFYESNNL